MSLFYGCNRSVGARETLNRGNAVVLIDRSWRTALSGAKGLCVHANFMFYYSKLCSKEKTIFTGYNRHTARRQILTNAFYAFKTFQHEHYTKKIKKS